MPIVLTSLHPTALLASGTVARYLPLTVIGTLIRAASGWATTVMTNATDVFSVLCFHVYINRRAKGLTVRKAVNIVRFW
jgi:hypothetical protein